MNIQQLLDACGKILAAFQRLVPGAKPPQSGPGNLRVRLVLTIAEQFEAALMLTTAHMSSHAATHVRSMIEALVTMKMLELKSDYVQQMRYERIRGEKRVYEAVLADPHLSDGVKQPIRERLASCKPEYDRLHATGVRPKRIVDEFGAAGLSHLVGPYAMLCNFTHNDLAALAFRHGDERKMVYRNDDSPQLIQAILSSAVQVLMVATYQLGELAAFTDGHFETVFNEMNAHWHTILDQPVVQGVE